MFIEDYAGSAGPLPLSSVFTPSPALAPGNVAWDDSEIVLSSTRAALDGSSDLVITAARRGANKWESARLDSHDRYSVQYGYIEARMKIPAGKGVWPAFWMLPTSSPYGTTAAGGEVDIIETINDGLLYGSVHNWSVPYTLSRTKSATYSDGQYHKFAINWKANFFEFFYDDVSYGTVVPADVPGAWVFNQPYYLILNLSVGGAFPGPSDATTPTPLNLIVDYVKVSAAI